MRSAVWAVSAIGLVVPVMAQANGLACGTAVDPRFPEAAALCGAPAGVPQRTQIDAPLRTAASVPFAATRQPRMRMAAPRRGARGGTLVDVVANHYRIDPALLAAMVRAESGGKVSARSHKGALGLMQVMPGTARSMGVKNPDALLNSPTVALSTGAKYLKTLQAKFGNNLPLVVAAYNAGPGAVVKAGNRVPSYRETQGYVGQVLRGYAANRGR